MKNTRKLLLILLCVVFVASLVACTVTPDPTPKTPELEIELVYEDQGKLLYVDEFNLAKAKLHLVSNGIDEYVPVTTEMLSLEDCEILATPGTHTVTVNFAEKQFSLTVTLRERVTPTPIYNVYNPYVTVPCDLSDFALGDIKLHNIYESSHQNDVAVTEAMISRDDLQKLFTTGAHQIRIVYQNVSYTTVVNIVDNSIVVYEVYYPNANVAVDVEEFNLSDVKLHVAGEALHTDDVPVTSAMLSQDDLEKLQTAGTHTITITYLEQTYTVTVKLTSGQVVPPVTIDFEDDYPSIASIYTASENASVTTCGIISGYVGKNFYIVNERNTNGVYIYCGNNSLYPIYNVGTYVIVKGTKSTYKGLVEITPSEITTATSALYTVTPTVLTDLAQLDDYMAMPISINNLTVSSLPGAWSVESSDMSFDVTLGANKALFFAKKQTTGGTNVCSAMSQMGLNGTFSVANAVVSCYNNAQIAVKDDTTVTVLSQGQQTQGGGGEGGGGGGTVVFEGDWTTLVWNENSNQSYYASANGKTGSALKIQLRSIVSTKTHPTTYNELRYFNSGLPQTDAGSTSGTIRMFYSHKEVSNKWHPSDGSADAWNREHVWPKSKGWYDNAGAGADIHHIRPELTNDNGARGNESFGQSSSVGFYPVVGGADSRGDVARILMYMLICYSETDSGYPITRVVNTNGGTNVSSAMALLLSWNAADPVDSYEIQRNNAAYKIQGNRNPFIDCEELAYLIWGN